MQLRNLQFSLNDDICIASRDTVSHLEAILIDKSYTQHRCSYFLYRLAVEILADIIGRHPKKEIKKEAYLKLKNVIVKNHKEIAISLAEALSNLPLKIRGPEIENNSYLTKNPPILYIEDILSNVEGDWCFYKKLGRNFIFKSQIRNKLLVLKLEQDKQKLHLLKKEALWMDFLKNMNLTDFHIPSPVKINDNVIFKLKGKLDGYVLAYLTNEDYFFYPNHPDILPPFEKFLHILSKGSWLFGKLTSQGIIHTDPIPLFHNRTEADRRDDRGVYLWTRGGRLDRWLESCMYPNFSLSGIRDFEHLISFKGSNRELFRLIGNHFLALLLVLGSYFRNKKPYKTGVDDKGNPVDVRYLFDKRLLQEGIKIILHSYYEGFVGEKFDLSLDTSYLAERMIEEMGVDRYMEELFRVQDQINMDEVEFKNFLISKGMSTEQISKLKKGRQDIVLYTGPHLGEFNGRISIPELLEFTAVCTALCMLNRSLKFILKTTGIKIT